MSAVAQQPVSVAIEANLPFFQMYKRGVLKTICGAMLDHGVLVVGYGTLHGTDYWKVKSLSTKVQNVFCCSCYIAICSF